MYPSPEPFHLSRRIYVGMTSLVEVPRMGSFRSVPEVICAFERSSCVVSGAYRGIRRRFRAVVEKMTMEKVPVPFFLFDFVDSLTGAI